MKEKIGKPIELHVGGVDSFQAVELAMRLAACAKMKP